MSVSHSLSAPHVLVVEDNAAFLDNLRELLDDAGYRVTGALSCREALERAEAGFDVALVDLRLPDGEGTELARELKEKVPESEVVLLTGFATVETAVAAVRAGACAYLMKPCAPSELLLTLEQAMRQVRLHAEKRELARRAQVTEKLAAVGSMTASLSHVIRNPLNAAALQLSMLERRVRRLSAEQQPQLLEPLLLVRDEIRRLDHTLEDFLQFARPRGFRPEPVEVKALLRRVVDFLAGQAEERQVRLELEGDGGATLPPLRGEEERLRQVLIHLTLNALEASPSGGLVRLSVSREAGLACIGVEDSGEGVPLELRERVFEPFFTTKEEGSGLGLSIVQAIVMQHGGSLEVVNAPSGGARFLLRLPLMS
ncbi:ATP-binding protein [Melittangium boletus]|uniref:histidine kinase n=1 Tax=Melittangium boletus DSM 14713 TaxID=1294270 RepID=A0A250IN61_9BACT|nr:ATP-binding protein [Melittangium boletus]ATB32690.1 hybrid sensor histidine kinase/response regulator [Melittangium boletus DSM 14713]